MRSTPRTKIWLRRSGLVLASYFGLYALNAAFGGYDPYFASDGRRRHDGGMLMHDCIMWQPRFGFYCNQYRHDLIGLVFYPLLQLDHQFVHKTHSIADGDFQSWLVRLTEADIHPAYRGDWKNWKREGKGF